MSDRGLTDEDIQVWLALAETDPDEAWSGADVVLLCRAALERSESSQNWRIEALALLEALVAKQRKSGKVVPLPTLH